MKMMYGHRLTGISHKKKKTICQDFFTFKKIEDVMIAAVADGLGSNKHSDFGSNIAATAAVDYCAKKINKSMSDDDILSEICASFDFAWQAVDNSARSQEYNVSECNTTLSLAVFINGEVYYGHVGDSGIFAFFEDGTIAPVTMPQKGREKNQTYPLANNRHKWEFVKVEKKAVALLLCTDGIWDMFHPLHLSNQDDKHYVSLLAWYIDPEAIEYRSKNADCQKWLEEEMDDINTNYPRAVGYDDITMFVMYDSEISFTKQPEAYYAKPSKEKIEKAKQEEYKRLYSHLKQENTQVEKESFQKNIAEAKSLAEICKYDRNYWLSMKERVEVAQEIFNMLANLSKLSFDFRIKNGNNGYPTEIYICKDEKTKRLNIKFDKYTANIEAYYHIIELTAMLLTNGLFIFPSQDGKNIAYHSSHGDKSYAYNGALLSEKLSHFFWKSYCLRHNNEDLKKLPSSAEWLDEIKKYLKIGRKSDCGQKAHYLWKSSTIGCAWCLIDEKEKERSGGE